MAEPEVTRDAFPTVMWIGKSRCVDMRSRVEFSEIG
jgi:hypothetical protein